MSMPQIMLAGKPVGQMGYGLMHLTWTPQPPPEEQSLAAMKAAADAGATAWSTAAFYGQPGAQSDNIKLIGRFFKKYPEYKDKIVIVAKGGIDDKMAPVDDIEFCRKELTTMKELLGREPDVYSLGRLPPQAAKEDVFNMLETLRKEGHFRVVGASEIKAATLDILHKISPVAVIEVEVSLWSYEQEVQDVISWSKAHKVPVFCYSPLGRGFISRTFKKPEDIPEGDFRGYMPRFQGETFYENLKLVDRLDELAKEKGMKTTQLALAWVTSLSPYNVPIPGSSSAERVRENMEAVNIKLSEHDLEGINKALSTIQVKGGRYPEAMSFLQMQ